MTLDDLDGIANVAFDQGQTITLVDDYEDGDLSEYVDNFNNGGVQTGTVWNGQYAASHTTSGTEKGIVISTSGLPYYPQQGDTWRHYYLTNNGSDYVGILGWAAQGTSVSANGQKVPDAGGYSIEVRHTSNTVYFNDPNGNRAASGSLSPLTGSWAYMRMEWQTDGTMNVTLHDASDDSQIGSVSYTDTSYTSGGIFWGQDSSDGNSHTCYYDYIHLP